MSAGSASEETSLRWLNVPGRADGEQRSVRMAATDDPEEWPVVCPECLWTPEERGIQNEAAQHIELTDAVKARLAGKLYGFLADREGRN